MPGYYATVDVWIGSVEPAGDAEIAELITDALANYEATVDVTMHAYPETED